VISFAVPAAPGKTALRVNDAGGRVVRNLGRDFSPGVQHVTWDGTDDRGQKLSAGVYFYRLEIAGVKFDRKLVLVR
jgi:flagellar hook assembly protein FlgD